MYFYIYHPANGVINHDCVRGQFEYNHVATVKANNIEEAFMKGQNDFNRSYRRLGLRSTCVGDIIQMVGELPNMVMGRGFSEVPPTVLSYIDWSNH